MALMRGCSLVAVVVGLLGSCAQALATPPPGCTAPTITYQRPPRYPPQAVREHLEGKVMVRLTVDVDGVPRDVAIATSSGSELLDQAAAETAATWHFAPMTCGGDAVPRQIDLPISFALNHEPIKSIPAQPTNVVTDDAPMEAGSIDAEMTFLNGLARLAIKRRGHVMSMLLPGAPREAWRVFESDQVKGHAVVRVREVALDGGLQLRVASLCEGADTWCRSYVANEWAVLRRSAPDDIFGAATGDTP